MARGRGIPGQQHADAARGRGGRGRGRARAQAGAPPVEQVVDIAPRPQQMMEGRTTVRPSGRPSSTTSSRSQHSTHSSAGAIPSPPIPFSHASASSYPQDAVYEDDAMYENAEDEVMDHQGEQPQEEQQGDVRPWLTVVETATGKE